MKLREALQKALVIFDWLERRTIYQDAQVKDAHDAVRAALAEPVGGEPVAWMIECTNGFTGWWCGHLRGGLIDCRFFDKDPNKAVVFPSKESAESVIQKIGHSCLRATSHQWMLLYTRPAAQEPAADEPVADDLPSREALADECSELRIILSKVTQALGTGAFASSACSLHFLSMIPEEVKKTVDGLRATRPAAAERGEYPPLPEPEVHDAAGYRRAYTADQMRAYVDADRAQRVPLTDEQIELLIDNSDGRWHDGEFCIDAQDLTKLLRSAHGVGAKP